MLDYIYINQYPTKITQNPINLQQKITMTILISKSPFSTIFHKNHSHFYGHTVIFFFIITIFLIFPTPTTQFTWQSITTGTQTIPGHTYLITINNVSDIISGVIYWNSTTPLIIYIFREEDNQIKNVYDFSGWQILNQRTFRYYVKKRKNHYMRVFPFYYDFRQAFSYNLNISTTSQPTIKKYTGTFNPLERLMAVTSITNMPQSSKYIPILFTYRPVSPSSTLLTQNKSRIDLKLALNTTLQRSLIANKVTCFKNNINSSTINQQWTLIFDHSIGKYSWIIQLFDFYQYELLYSTESNQCEKYCETGSVWSNAISQCAKQIPVSHDLAGSQMNDGNSSVNSGWIWLGTGLLTLISFVILICMNKCQTFCEGCCKTCTQCIQMYRQRCRAYLRRNAAVQPQNNLQPIGRNEIQSRVEIKLQQKNEKKQCTICLGDESCSAILPCAHTFHRICIQEWGRRNLKCPNCRKKFLIKDIKDWKDVAEQQGEA